MWGLPTFHWAQLQHLCSRILPFTPLMYVSHRVSSSGVPWLTGMWQHCGRSWRRWVWSPPGYSVHPPCCCSSVLRHAGTTWWRYPPERHIHKTVNYLKTLWTFRLLNARLPHVTKYKISVLASPQNYETFPFSALLTEHFCGKTKSTSENMPCPYSHVI